MNGRGIRLKRNFYVTEAFLHKKKAVTFRLSFAVLTALEDAHWRVRRSKTSIVEEALRAYLPRLKVKLLDGDAFQESSKNP